MRISDWSSDVCSSDLGPEGPAGDAVVSPARTNPRQHQPWHHQPWPRRAPRHPVGGPMKAVVHVTLKTGVLDPQGRAIGRSDERREGNECVSTCRSRWSRYHEKKKTKLTQKKTT